MAPFNWPIGAERRPGGKREKSSAKSSTESSAWPDTCADHKATVATSREATTNKRRATITMTPSLRLKKERGRKAALYHFQSPRLTGSEDYLRPNLNVPRQIVLARHLAEVCARRVEVGVVVEHVVERVV